MAKALSEDIRKRVIKLSKEENLRSKEIGRRLLISERSALRIIRLEEATGCHKAKGHEGRDTRKYFREVGELSNFVKENPEMTGKEMAEHFGCSASLICMRLKEEKISYKKNICVS